MKKKRKTGFSKNLLVLFVAGLILFGLLILYPFWWLFAWIVNLVGIKGIRNTNGNIETPVVFFEHPETKRRIVFIATIHIAEAEYFVTLQRLIESLSGYKILFEGVGKLSPQEEQALTRKERDVADYFFHTLGMVKRIGRMMSLRYQKEGLTYKSNWVNTDMKMYNLIQLFAQHDFRLLKKKKNANNLFSNESELLFMRWLCNKLLSRFVPVIVIVNALVLFSRDQRLTKRFIIEARNEKAVRGINVHLAEGDVAAIWGVAHLRGIEKQLRRAGFREVGRSWYTAYCVRDLTLLECLRTMNTPARRR